MTRIKGWEQLLDTFLLSSEKVQFTWGTHDCCLFAADAVASITGIDIASDFRNQYTTQLGAFKTIATVTSGKTVEDAVAWCASKHGLTEWTHPLCAQRGDLALFKQGTDTLGGIVHLNGREIVTVGEGGLVRLPITSIYRAWKV